MSHWAGWEDSTDVVSLSALRLATTIGLDHWHRTRPQPISLSVYLHLTPSYLDLPGQSDDVANSLHYGHLAKAIEQRVSAKEGIYPSARTLVGDVTDAAFSFVVNATGRDRDENEAERVVHAIRIVLELPKQVLLAERFQVELTTRTSDWQSARAPGAIVRVLNLTLPVLIGVNPPERLAKQRVVTNIIFFEADHANAGGEADIDYPAIVQQVATVIERSTYLTLERLVYEIIQTAYQVSDAYESSSVPRIHALTVQCQKPSALSFADASGVEMTRTRSHRVQCVPGDPDRS